MKNKPIVHIGLAKAASTFLQHVVFSKLNDFYYVGKNLNELEVQRALSATVRVTSLSYDEHSIREVLQAAMNRHSRGRRVIFSEEDCSVFKFLDIATMADRLRGIFGEYDVIYVPRSPFSWVPSQYYFRLSTLHPTTLYGMNYWLDYHRNVVGIGSDIAEIRFAGVAKIYRQRCGGCLTIAPYELLKTDRDAFVLRIAEALGVEEAVLRPLFDSPRNRRRDKLRITQRDNDFIKMARFILMDDLPRFWAEFNEAVEPIPGAKASEHYQALETLYKAGSNRFTHWRPHLLNMRSSILEHLELGGPADEHLDDDHLIFLRRVTSSQAQVLKSEFGVDLRNLAPGEYEV